MGNVNVITKEKSKKGKGRQSVLNERRSSSLLVHWRKRRMQKVEGGKGDK